METKETRVPRFFSNRPVMILVFGVAIIVVCIVLVAVAVTVLRSSRNSPISVDIYPNSQLINKSQGANADYALYATKDSVQQVLDFYDKRLPKDSGDSVSVQGCQKIYTDDNKATMELPGHFYVKCVEDNSQLDVVQQLLVTINYEVNKDTQKPETRFAIERHWGSQ